MNSKQGSGSLLIGGPIGRSRDSSGGGGGESPDGPTSGFSTAAPPPPPPPPPPFPSSTRPAASPASAIRINALETAVPMRRRPLSNDFGATSNEMYEPPAAIQNAMMTKDKKPFTYTPGMGGKLDLSQIRSPRMARRVAKNANDEGIEAPSPRSAAPANPTGAAAAAAVSPSLYAAQPRVAVPVFPTGAPNTNNNNNNNRLSSNVQVKIATPATPKGQIILPTPPTRSQTSQPQSPPSPPSTPTSPSTPSSAQIILAKAPTPWLQNRNKSQQEELPEWAKRKQSSATTSSSSPSPPPPPERQPQQNNPRERIIPLRIEDRPSVFCTDNGARQRSQPAVQQQSIGRHQQRWGNASPSPPVDGPGTYIVPIILEAGPPGDATGTTANNNNNNRIVRHAGGGGGGGVGGPPSPQYQEQTTTEPAPVQSRSFRVLQKITDTDLPIDRLDGQQQQQSRKLRLTENDKLLMNKVKERVDGEGAYLHQEEDPRYRGAAIPSRAFRYLRNMTDSADPSLAVATVNKQMIGPTTRNVSSPSPGADEFRTMVVPASEQQAPEPKKYTGSAIPSRSFRMLQAMTSPETIVASASPSSSITPRESSPPVASAAAAAAATTMVRKPPPWYDCVQRNKIDDDDVAPQPATAAVVEDGRSSTDDSETSDDDDSDSDSYLAYSTGHRDKPTMQLDDPIENFHDENIGNDVCVEFKISIRAGNVSVQSKSPSPSSASSENESIDFWKEITMSRGDDDNSSKKKAAAEQQVSEEKEEEPPEESKAIVETSTPAIVIELTEAPQDRDYRHQSPSLENFLKETSDDDDDDDEDSGVTSDTSRLISEIDTDSECGSGKTSAKRAAINRYKRTQTHSRLFKLLSNVEVSSDSRISNLGEEKAPADLRVPSSRNKQQYAAANGAPPPKLPNWNFRRPVSCPRIKSWTNLPRAGIIGGEKDSCNVNGDNNNRSTARKLAPAPASFPRDEYGRC